MLELHHSPPLLRGAPSPIRLLQLLFISKTLPQAIQGAYALVSSTNRLLSSLFDMFLFEFLLTLGSFYAGLGIECCVNEHLRRLQGIALTSCVLVSLLHDLWCHCIWTIGPIPLFLDLSNPHLMLALRPLDIRLPLNFQLIKCNWLIRNVIDLSINYFGITFLANQFKLSFFIFRIRMLFFEIFKPILNDIFKLEIRLVLTKNLFA